jgi:hypothetical protein
MKIEKNIKKELNDSLLMRNYFFYIIIQHLNLSIL